VKDFLQLQGKVALVIGGGLGMGESTAMNFAEAGCDVAIADIDAGRAELVAARVRAAGRRASVIAADAMDEGSAGPAIAQVTQELGGLDILATIIGQAEWSSMLELSPERWDLDHRRNLRYFFFYAQAAARVMVKQGRGGAITAVASVSGMQSAPSHAAYGAAKAGLINLVRTMGVELAKHNIRVNAVAPGAIRTPRTEKTGDPKATAARIGASLVPFRRQGETQEIADAILFLSSGLASFITGVTLPVDGGLTAQFLFGDPLEA
jgi:NAD(P)-dependent dehydrogenase (short-subunit alcohol dehydrogenase family)